MNEFSDRGSIPLASTRIIRMNITFVRILLFIDAQIVAHHFLDLLTGIPNAFCNFSSSDGTGHYSLAAEALEEDFGRFAVGREAAEDGASALWEAILDVDAGMPFVV